MYDKTPRYAYNAAGERIMKKDRFTKHYFIGDKRIASRIGTGLFNNGYGRNGSYVTAGQQDYAERMNQTQKQKINNYFKE